MDSDGVNVALEGVHAASGPGCLVGGISYPVYCNVHGEHIG